MKTTKIKISPVDIEARQKIEIRAGDTVKVWQKIQEKGKTRLQLFEGLVLAVKHGKEPGGTFTVRKVASGVGVEKVFPIYSPMIDKIEVVKRSKVRQSKLYHIRKKAAKEIRRQMRNSRMIGESTEDLAEPNIEEEVINSNETKIDAEKVEEVVKKEGGPVEDKPITIEEKVAEKEAQEKQEESPAEEEKDETNK